jgi:hypothetical protein
LARYAAVQTAPPQTIARAGEPEPDCVSPAKAPRSAHPRVAVHWAVLQADDSIHGGRQLLERVIGQVKVLLAYGGFRGRGDGRTQRFRSGVQVGAAGGGGCSGPFVGGLY